jgi:hypothetical protein
LPTFLQNCSHEPLESEHPCQGSFADLKLDWQPPAQLPVALASLASFADTESGAADGVRAATDARRDTVLRATAWCAGLGGLATRFGASTTISGSELAALPEGVAVCDIAVPLRPHRSNAVDKMATARPATKSNEALMAISFSDFCQQRNR